MFKRVTWHFPLTRHLENSLFVDLTFAQAQMDFLHGKLFILERKRNRGNNSRDEDSGGEGGGGRGGGERDRESGHLSVQDIHDEGSWEISEDLEKKVALLICLQIIAEDERDTTWNRLGESRHVLE